MKLFTIKNTSDWDNSANPGGVRKVTYVSGVDSYQDTAYILPAWNTRDWIINLHGHGSLGNQLFIRQDVRNNWLKLFMELGLSVMTADLRGNAWMCPEAATDLHCLVEWMRSEYGAERFVLVAGSMGGTGSLAYSVLYPEDISAVVAYCPATDIGRYHGLIKNDNRPVIKEISAAIEYAYGGRPADLPDLFAKHSACANHEKLKGMNVLVIHGVEDLTIPVSESRNLAENIHSSKTFEYIEIKDGTHDSILAEPVLAPFLKRQ